MLSRSANLCSKLGRRATVQYASNVSKVGNTSSFPSVARYSSEQCSQTSLVSSTRASSWFGGEDSNSFQRRNFASRRRRNAPKKKSSNVLANEKLIKVLMKKQPQATPNNLMVRLVIDEGPDVPATVEVVSLADAIQASVDRMTDLIGTSLNTDPPVIRATQLSKLEYKKEQVQQKKKVQQKTFRFRSGIDEHDLERKVNDINRFLKKGLECDFSVFTKARMMRQNSNAGMELVERIRELISEFGEFKKPPSKNEQGNRLQVKIEPKKK